MAGVLGARFRLTVMAGVVGLIGAFAQATPAAAQAAFCNLPGGFVEAATGFCVNNQGGAFSAAALSSQSLSQVTQSVSQQSNAAVSQAVSDRRTEEQQRCPAGFQRVGGACQRVTAPEQRATSPTRPAAKPAAAKGKQAPQRVIVSKDPIQPLPAANIYEYAVRPSVWAQGFGEVEKRDSFAVVPVTSFVGTAGCPAGTILAVGGIPGGGVGVACRNPNTNIFVSFPGTVTAVQTPTFFNLGSTARTWGVVGGADLTFRGVAAAGDGLIAGVLSGFTSTEIEVRTAANTKLRYDGPSIGLFATYFNGGFSADLTVKADFFDLEQTFAEFLDFGANGFVLNANKLQSNFVNYTVAGNLGYKFFMSPTFWIEPTGGFRYMRSDYANSAIVQGFDDGDVLWLQGGARIGSTWNINGTIVTPSLTGMAYSAVSINGFVIGAGSVGSIVPFAAGGILPQNDEGKLRGLGIARIDFDFGNGVQSFIQGNVYGGEDLLGYGGRAGIRFVF